MERKLTIKERIKFKATEYLAYFEAESKILAEKILLNEKRVENTHLSITKAESNLDIFRSKIKEYKRAKGVIDNIISNESFKLRDEAGLLDLKDYYPKKEAE